METQNLASVWAVGIPILLADEKSNQCLVFGRTQERLARSQESYIMDATNSWLESLERSMVQMKEYQAARKKLETRRLAYDTSLAKMQKAKKEDFRVEEELRSQKAKYEESEDEVYRRMQDIKEAETESVADLSTFLDAELAYHDKCREALLQLRQEWPAGYAHILSIALSWKLTQSTETTWTDAHFVPTQDHDQTLLVLTLSGRRERSKCPLRSHDHQSSRIALLPIEGQNPRLEISKRKANHDQTLHDQPPSKDLPRFGETYRQWACNVWLDCRANLLPFEQRSRSFGQSTRRFLNTTYFKMIRTSITIVALTPTLTANDLSHLRPLTAVEALLH